MNGQRDIETKRPRLIHCTILNRIARLKYLYIIKQEDRID
jgi:hypothetical protein